MTNLTIIMITIMMGKMDMLFPDMYMIKRFIGTCFMGPRATSQLRFILRFGSDSLNNKKYIWKNKGMIFIKGKMGKVKEKWKVMKDEGKLEQ